MTHRIDRPMARTRPQCHPRRDAGVVERGGLENLRHFNNLLIHRLNYIRVDIPTPYLLLYFLLDFDRMEAKPDPRKRTNAYDKRTIPGYLEKLKLMRIPTSCFWWVNIYILGGPSSGVKKSTKCERFSDAAEFAKEWYEDRLLDQKGKTP